MASLNRQLATANGNATTLSYDLYAVAALAVVSLVIGILALVKKGRAAATTAPPR